MAKRRQIYIGTCLSDAFFVYLMDLVARERLRDVLVQTYLTPEIQPQVAPARALLIWMHSPIMRGGMN